MDDLQYALKNVRKKNLQKVLNLVINGWPSILEFKNWESFKNYIVLNLVINGWPSILFKFSFSKNSTL